MKDFSEDPKVKKLLLPKLTPFHSTIDLWLEEDNDVYVYLSYKISNKINKLLSDIIITERENHDIITIR